MKTEKDKTIEKSYYDGIKFGRKSERARIKEEIEKLLKYRYRGELRLPLKELLKSIGEKE